MQVSMGRNRVDDSFEAEESPMQEVKFVAADGEKKVARIGKAIEGCEREKLAKLYNKFGHLFIIKIT